MIRPSPFPAGSRKGHFGDRASVAVKMPLLPYEGGIELPPCGAAGQLDSTTLQPPGGPLAAKEVRPLTHGACLSSDRAVSVALAPEARYSQSNHGGGKQTAAGTEQNLGTA